jgi:hypothetical protein
VGWVKDNTSRFLRRPYYQQSFLDQRCQRLIVTFLTRLYGQVTIPVPSGALIKLVERDAADLDLYAELPEGVLGVTHFDPPRKPRVQIARTLFEDARRLHRWRFTLAHEYAHVAIHAPLYLRAGLARREDHPCTDPEIDASPTRIDWMEWQASYAAGALLMPISRLRALITACLPGDLPAPLPADEPAGRDLQQRASEAFMVSPDAAAVRLAQLGYVALHHLN